jgi:hypothetical protein
MQLMAGTFNVGKDKIIHLAEMCERKLAWDRFAKVPLTGQRVRCNEMF